MGEIVVPMTPATSLRIQDWKLFKDQMKDETTCTRNGASRVWDAAGSPELRPTRRGRKIWHLWQLPASTGSQGAQQAVDLLDRFIGGWTEAVKDCQKRKEHHWTT